MASSTKSLPTDPKVQLYMRISRKNPHGVFPRRVSVWCNKTVALDQVALNAVDMVSRLLLKVPKFKKK